MKRNVHFGETFEESRFFLSTDAPRGLTSNTPSPKLEKKVIIPNRGYVSVINLREKSFNSTLGSSLGWSLSAREPRTFTNGKASKRRCENVKSWISKGGSCSFHVWWPENGIGSRCRTWIIPLFGTFNCFRQAFFLDWSGKISIGNYKGDASLHLLQCARWRILGQQWGIKL